jgi:NADH:ubiquinone oxidoreductase subunit 2 (subunit N)
MNTLAATPPLIVAGTAVLALLAGLLPTRWARREGPTIIAIAGLLAAAVMSIVLWGNRIVALGGGYRIDRLGVLFNLIFIGCAIATLLLSVQESAGVDRRGEYAALVVTATAGMVLVAGAGDLITIFLGIEILSRCTCSVRLSCGVSARLRAASSTSSSARSGRRSCCTGWRSCSGRRAPRISQRSAADSPRRHSTPSRCYGSR